MTAKKLKTFLDEAGVRYETIEHEPTFTASQAAATAHVSGHMLAKTVVLKTGGRFVMAVVPAHEHVELASIENALRTRAVELATEHEFMAKFPGCEVGALPPFGNLYGMPTYIDPELSESEHIAFNAGTHTELIRMAYRDFARLVQPHLLEVAAHDQEHDRHG